MPQTTTHQDIKSAYNRDGYVIVPGLYEPERMKQWKRIMIEDLRPRMAGNPSAVHVWTCDRLPPPLLEAVGDQRIGPILQQLIGPDIEFLSAKAVYKDSSTRFGSPWHQDWFYWGGAPKLSVWIAIDDASPENGCLQFVPGTHRGVFRKQQVDDVKGFVNRIGEEDLEGMEVRSIACSAGDAVFFHDLLVHGSHPNTSGEDRWSLISTYRDGSAKDDSTTWQRSIVISGRSVNGGAAMEG